MTSSPATACPTPLFRSVVSVVGLPFARSRSATPESLIPGPCRRIRRLNTRPTLSIPFLPSISTASDRLLTSPAPADRARVVRPRRSRSHPSRGVALAELDRRVLPVLCARSCEDRPPDRHPDRCPDRAGSTESANLWRTEAVCRGCSLCDIYMSARYRPVIRQPSLMVIPLACRVVATRRWLAFRMRLSVLAPTRSQQLSVGRDKPGGRVSASVAGDPAPMMLTGPLGCFYGAVGARVHGCVHGCVHARVRDLVPFRRTPGRACKLAGFQPTRFSTSLPPATFYEGVCNDCRP